MQKQERCELRQGLWVLLCVLGLGAAGCITMGRPFQTAEIKSIAIGKTRQMDIERIFGLPYRTGIESGDLTWTYLNYHLSALGPQQTTDLYIRFNADGTVKSYAFNTNVPDSMPK